MSSPRGTGGLGGGLLRCQCPGEHAESSGGGRAQPVVQEVEVAQDDGMPSSHVPGVSLCAAHGWPWKGGREFLEPRDTTHIPCAGCALPVRGGT